MQVTKTFRHIFFLIPIINAIADVTVYYFKDIGAGGFHLGLLRGFVIVLIHFLLTFRTMIKNSINTNILIFLIYFLIIGLFSSALSVTFNAYLKWFSAILLFPLAYYFTNTVEDIIYILKTTLIAGIIIVINLVIGQLTSFGVSAYLEDSFYTGGAGVGITNNLSLILLLSPLFFSLKRNFSSIYISLFYASYILFFIFIFIGMKRAAIVGLSLGFLTYYIFNYRKSKILLSFIIFISLLIISFPLYQDKLVQRYEARSDKIMDYEEEGRYQEIFYAIDEFNEGTISHKFFGTELFNSQMYFGPKYFGRNRMIHGDVTGFFYGGGLIGLFLYILLLFNLFKVSVLGLKRASPINKEVSAIMLGILASYVLMTLTGAGSIGALSLIYLSLGTLFAIKVKGILL